MSHALQPLGFSVQLFQRQFETLQKKEVLPDFAHGLKEQLNFTWFSQGDLIFQQGVLATEAYFLYQGCVKLERLAPSGKRLLLELINPVTPLGCCALGGETRHLVSATALTYSQVGFMPVDRFTDWLQTQPQTMLDCLKLMARHTLNLYQRLEQMAYASVREQLLFTLHSMGQRCAPDERGHVVIPLMAQDMAKWVGTSRETVAREFRTLKKQKLLRVGHNRLILLDLPRFEQLVEEFK